VTLNQVLKDACFAEALAAAHLADLLKDMAPGRLQLIIMGLQKMAERHALEWKETLDTIEGAKR
jgi:hypothetical protein